MDENTMLSIPH